MVSSTGEAEMFDVSEVVLLEVITFTHAKYDLTMLILEITNKKVNIFHCWESYFKFIQTIRANYCVFTRSTSVQRLATVRDKKIETEILLVESKLFEIFWKIHWRVNSFNLSLSLRNQITFPKWIGSYLK